MASGEDQSSSSTTTIDAVAFASQFECPICYNLGRPPIRTCMSGHLVCSECIEKIDNWCPTCRGAMGVHKNLILDNLAHLLTYPCLHSFNGCNVSNKLSAIINHEQVCPFRPCVCPYTDFGCEWKGEPDQLITHLKSNHSIPFHRAKRLNLNITHINQTTPQTWFFLTQCYRFPFFITVHKQKEGTHFQIEVVIQIIAHEECSHKFTFTASSKAGPKFFFQEAPVAGAQSLAKQVRDEGLGIVYGRKDLKYYISDECMYILIKLKEIRTDNKD